MLCSFQYKNKKLKILDQLLLPLETKFIPVKDVQDGWSVINKMQVRGAPAIAIIGCLSLAVELYSKNYKTKDELKQDVEQKLKYLVTARPTAVNIKLAADDLIKIADLFQNDSNLSYDDMKIKIIQSIEAMMEKDISDNKAIGKAGYESIITQVSSNEKVRVLTHCNTGSLATAYYGTALGVIRFIFEQNRLEHAYCTETRPYNQGARLTAYELVHDNIPATLICDNMVAALMKTQKIHAVLVGADRVAANGDTANKIGTYQIAVSAKYHSIPFYVCAPLTTIDFNIPNGDHIVIEQRPENEMTQINGQRIAAPGIKVWNPAFDVTPAELITGIVTNYGTFLPSQLEQLKSKR